MQACNRAPAVVCGKLVWQVRTEILCFIAEIVHSDLVPCSVSLLGLDFC